MKVCQSLAAKLELYSKSHNITVNDLWELVLFEVPDEALEEYHNMANPTEIEITPELEAMSVELAADFGMTPLGLSVMMDRLMDKAVKVMNKTEEYERSARADGNTG